MSDSVQWLEIDEDSAGQRIDNVLLRLLKGVPKSRIYRIVRKGEVRLNGGRVKADTRVQAGDKLRIPPIRTAEAGAQAPIPKTVIDLLESAIAYEDERMLILNKPAGIAVHGGSGLSMGVIEGLRQLRPQARFLELVHRLDRGTSGCLMIAKKRSQLRRLQDLLREKSSLAGQQGGIEKHYITVVHGRWPARRQQVDAPLRKLITQGGERISRVSAEGKAALTRMKVLAYDDTFSVLAVQPVTGRTHQIRVHCQYLHHPVVGDDKYGWPEQDQAVRASLKSARLMLHASALFIPALEGSKPIRIEVPPDADMQRLIERVQG